MLHRNISYVTNTAVEADADASRFPSTWLFSARWNKGKKGSNDFVLVSPCSSTLGQAVIFAKQADGLSRVRVPQPDGSISTISFVTVGGRTSAVVDRVQILPEGLVKAKAKGKRKKKAEEDEEPEEETITDKETTPRKKRSNGRTRVESTKWKVQMIETVVTAAGGQEPGESDEVKHEVDAEEVQTENSRAIVSLFSRNAPMLLADFALLSQLSPHFKRSRQTTRIDYCETKLDGDEEG